MEPKDIPLNIEVDPKSQFLSPEQLTKYRNVEIEPVCLGMKRSHLSGDQEEAEELSRLRAEFKKLISVPRIERLAGRALGEWDAIEQAVCVTRKDGKFECFGYSRRGKHYLEYFEALFLLELGRLQLEYNHQIVSVEQAYILLLGEDASPKFKEYLVYSNFMRVGYILVSYQNVPQVARMKYEKNECIWALVRQELRIEPIAKPILQSPHFNEIKQSMEETKRRIQKSINSNEEELPEEHSSMNFQRKIQTSGKRKVSKMHTTQNHQRSLKRSRFKFLQNKEQQPPLQQSNIDILKNEPEYQEFYNIFHELDIIELKSNVDTTTARRQLQIKFDVHLHSGGFKKSSPAAPKFRLIILENNETFPTHAEIANCYNQQQCKVPLIVVSISESKRIQAFIYFFI